jgi:hypothetical protein
MTTREGLGHVSTTVIADVKCYFCGHVSGQIVGRRDRPLRITDFKPRPGYTGPEAKPGQKMRCERCHGPVFLEDAGSAIVPSARADRALAKRLAGKKTQAA